MNERYSEALIITPCLITHTQLLLTLARAILITQKSHDNHTILFKFFILTAFIDQVLPACELSVFFQDCRDYYKMLNLLIWILRGLQFPYHKGSFLLPYYSGCIITQSCKAPLIPTIFFAGQRAFNNRALL